MPERMSMLRMIEVVVLEERMQVFRIAPERESPEFEDAFRSHSELGRPPRGPENRAAGGNIVGETVYASAVSLPA
jgi:hypothetical protein